MVDQQLHIEPGVNHTIYTDDLDFSSIAVSIKKTTTLTALGNGAQTCEVGDFVDEPKPQADDEAVQQVQEAEPQGLSQQPQPLQWDIRLPTPEEGGDHDGEPNWCILLYEVEKEIKDAHVNNTGGPASQAITILVCGDTDGDNWTDNCNGPTVLGQTTPNPVTGEIKPLDNCKLIDNPGQEDSNDNSVGDACDSDRDVGEKFITVIGPGPINVSDTIGRYMWVIGEMGNFDADPQTVTISINVDPINLPGCDPTDLDQIIPGQSTFTMFPEEQKFQVFRLRYECHAAQQDTVVYVDVEKCIEFAGGLDDDNDGEVDEDSRDGIDDDADSEDGEDPPNPDSDPSNDCKSVVDKPIIIDVIP